MKINRQYLIVLSTILFAAGVKAQTVVFPQNPVVGVLGASFSTCQAPKNSPLGGVGLAGCSYEGLYEALIKDPKIIKKNYRVETVANGGGFSYDVPGTGWTGLSTQLADMTARTSWFDGVQRLKAIVITTVNDCLHSIPCSQADVQNVLIQNTKNAIATAKAQGLQVYVSEYPKWNQINLALAAQTYGLTNVINETDYNYLRNQYKQEISAIPGVVYLESWKNNFSPFDGLHPSQANVRKAAKKIGQLVTQ